MLWRHFEVNLLKWTWSLRLSFQQLPLSKMQDWMRYPDTNLNMSLEVEDLSFSSDCTMSICAALSLMVRWLIGYRWYNNYGWQPLAVPNIFTCFEQGQQSYIHVLFSVQATFNAVFLFIFSFYNVAFSKMCIFCLRIWF